MTTYISEETDLPVVIACRFCLKFDKETVPAVALQGQWEGGDPDVEPHWVPVCEKHDAQWAIDADTGEPMPEKYRLPRFELTPDEVPRSPTCPDCGRSQGWNGHPYAPCGKKP